jgi:hypothetical protein
VSRCKDFTLQKCIAMEPLINIHELSKGLKIPVKTIRNKLSDGTWPIPPVQIGRALRWHPSTVAKGLSLLAKEPRPQAGATFKKKNSPLASRRTRAEFADDAKAAPQNLHPTRRAPRTRLSRQ